MGLITDIQQIKDHVSIDSDLTLPTLQPHINFSERYFKKVLGTAQYLALDTAIKTVSTTQEQDALLDQIFPSLSRLSVAVWSRSGSLSIGGTGIRRTEDSNQKTAYKYQEDGLVKALILEGFDLLDDLLEFLEANEDDYLPWKADAVAYTKFKKFFINTTDEFEKEYGIGGSRITFRAFYPILKHVDYMNMRPVIGSDLYDEIKSEIELRTISPENQTLLDEFIRPAIAHMVIAEAMDILPVQISENGVRVVEVLQSFPSDVMEKNAPEAVRSPKINAANTKAQQYLTDLVNELKDNASATKYATYFNQFGTVETEARNTDPTKGIYRA